MSWWCDARHFGLKNRMKLIYIIGQTEPIAPRSIDPSVPRDLETIILKSIDKDPKPSILHGARVCPGFTAVH